jgi:hypothetical protein
LVEATAEPEAASPTEHANATAAPTLAARRPLAEAVRTKRFIVDSPLPLCILQLLI